MHDATISGRRFARAGYTILSAFLVAFFLVVGLAEDPARQTAIDLLNIVAPLVALTLCVLAAERAPDRRLSIFWILVATGLALCAAAEIIWAVYELILGVDAPYPSLADAFWLLYYPVQFAALVMLLAWRGKDRIAGIASGLDSLLFGLAAAALVWRYIAIPAFDGNETWLSNAVTISYPAGDVLLIIGLASLTLMSGRKRLPAGIVWIASSFAIDIVVDLLYVVSASTGTYSTGSWLDPVWAASYAFVGVAALQQISRSGHSTETVGSSGSRLNEQAVQRRHPWLERTHILLPYISLPVAGHILFSSVIAADTQTQLERISSAVVAVLIVGMVVARQFVTLMENRRLRASLEVEKSQLGLLNQAAMEMSHCGTSRLVIETSLRLVQRAMACESVGIWLRPTKERERFHGSIGLERAERSLLRSAARGEMSHEGPDCLMGPLTIPVGSDGNGHQPLFSSIVVLPLVSRQIDVGALVIGIPHGAPSDLDERIALTSTVSSQVAVTLENVRRFEDARYLAERDSVTGLLNHRSIDQRIRQEAARCGRTDGRFSLVMMDLDDFKYFNDTYGHTMGDEALTVVAGILRRVARRSDVVSRYGGDEFLALLPDTDGDQALALVERIQAALATSPFQPDRATPVPILVSFGIATYPEDGYQAEEVLFSADVNLYQSKAEGGNCITAGGASRSAS